VNETRDADPGALQALSRIQAGTSDIHYYEQLTTTIQHGEVKYVFVAYPVLSPHLMARSVS